MRRKPILILCTLNAVVAVVVLGICLPKLLAKPSQQITQPQSKAKTDTPAPELWAKAINASDARETLFYLNQIEDQAFKKAQIETALQQLISDTATPGLPLNRLNTYSSFITICGQLAQSRDDLDSLILLAQQQTLSITLKEAALRSCIEACVRLYQIDQDPLLHATAYNLIDSTYTEQGTSLSDLAYQADWHLHNNDMLSDERLERFQQKLLGAVQAPDSTQSTQLVCLNILNTPSNQHLASNEALYDLYERTPSNDTKASILSFFVNKKDPGTEIWLSERQATSPRIEQLQLTALEALRSSGEEQPVGNIH
ncbi:MULTISPECIES: hypothetical protein [unclassified Lentimonas]|uniref:hypothetical protein n=1 Tax=unclassified Lentimonas TaxID=2630993 RepID=UPI0013236C6A|nr:MULTISPECIES: hypothetical protein [unclassified Lentimonas]CAA6690082.1 Unannotated [Lentimonas sp. CC19]CAA6690970.1 Unannotated [Lentimonas sp. CC10]CAA7070693.1 Unannotated [Lentimonas sp. CC11]